MRTLFHQFQISKSQFVFFSKETPIEAPDSSSNSLESDTPQTANESVRVVLDDAGIHESQDAEKKAIKRNFGW